MNHPQITDEFFRGQVSIPFKRESVSKVSFLFLSLFMTKSFNSLQTGKRIQSMIGYTNDGLDKLFQFPSNGKAYPKTRTFFRDHRRREVSIPFKRESVSKVEENPTITVRQDIVSIPFKRESVSKGR